RTSSLRNKSKIPIFHSRMCSLRASCQYNCREQAFTLRTGVRWRIIQVAARATRVEYSPLPLPAIGFWVFGAPPASTSVVERSYYLMKLSLTGLSDDVGGVKHFSRTLQRALGEERHFALVDGFAFSNPGSLVISQVGNSVRPMH